MARTRREFLGLAAGAAFGATACRQAADDVGSTTTSTTQPTTTTSTEPPVGPYPFGLGVASGDPDHRSVVLWTAVDRTAPTDLDVEVATDEAMTDVVFASTATAGPDAGMSVHVVADSLEPDTTYWYRFWLDGHATRPARTRTAPAPGRMPDQVLTVGHLSCMRFSSGYWTALDDVATTAPDVVVCCGDYVYESDGGVVRPVGDPPPSTLDEYRALWRRYKGEPELQAAHAVAPWLMVWDDHEVENNYQGDTPGDPPGGAAFLDQRAAAYRAWWEFTPTRLDPPDGPDLRIHRTVPWGALTTFVLLDTRQYRDDQPCGPDVAPRCAGTETATMLGAEQESWFEAEIAANEAVWTSVVQQVVVHQWRFLPGNRLWNLDQWDGYTGARRALLDVLAGAPDPVVLTGDVHSSWVADLRLDFDDEASTVVAAEFVAPGISSDVPEQLRGAGSLVELSSPHIAWSETTRRGWVLHEVTPETWTATYRLVEDASVPGSAVEAASSWAVSAGSRGLA